MLKKLRALGAYLKEQHTNGSQMYSALFLTVSTIAVGGVFGWAALGAATMANAVGMGVAGAVGVALGAYAGAPMVKEFVSGAINAVKNADSDGTNAPKSSPPKTGEKSLTGPKSALKADSAWDRIKSLTSVFRHSSAPKTTAQHGITAPKQHRAPGLV